MLAAHNNTPRGFIFWRRFLPVFLCTAIIVAFFLSLNIGPIKLSLTEYWAALWFTDATVNNTAEIIFQLRLPRISLALIVGATLGITGAALQGLFRNPLADPSLIGISAGASLGAAIAIATISVWSINSFLFPLFQIVLAFVFAFITVLTVYFMAASNPNGGGRSVVTMLLAGIAITALVGAVTSLLKFLVDDKQLRQVSLWQMGSLEGHSWGVVAFAYVLCGFCILVIAKNYRALNAFLLGEANALYIGVAVAKAKRQVIFSVALATATTVALVGIIGFVGLLAPHSVRLLVGPNHKYLLPNSALAGALMVLLADILARVLSPPLILPVGVITALVGGPVFLWLLVFGKGAYQWRT